MDYKVVDGIMYLHLSKKDEQELGKKYSDLIIPVMEKDCYVDDCQSELEEIIFEHYPDIRDCGYYVAITGFVHSGIEMHPYPTDGIPQTRLYHMTANSHRIISNGFRGSKQSSDGVRYSEERVYFSTTPFSSKQKDLDEFMEGMEELLVIFSDPVMVYHDPEYPSDESMVFVKFSDMKDYTSALTGFKYDSPRKPVSQLRLFGQ